MTEQKTIYFDSKGLVCKLVGSPSKINEMLKDPFTYHYIPDLKVITSSGDFPEKYNVSIEEAEILLPVTLSYPTANYFSNLPERDIVATAGYLLERARQEEKGFYSLNSSTAVRDGKAITFYSDATNSGKTSSMLHLVKNLGFEFYTDEHTLIDLKNAKVVGGSRSVALRKDFLKKQLGSSKEFTKVDNFLSPVTSKLFIYPHLDDGFNKQYKERDDAFFWLLNKSLAGVIRGTSRLVNNFAFPLPPLETQLLALKRVALLREFTKKVPCYFYQGPLKGLDKLIEREF